MADHWFDTLNKALVQKQPRRTLLGVATALVMNAPFSAAAKKNQGKNNHKHNKKKNNKKRKGKNPLAECQIPDGMPCSGRACGFRWAGCSRYDTTNRNHCEFICEQCKAPGNGPFCILGGEVADCCNPGEVCCGGDHCAQLGTQDHCIGCDHPCHGEGVKCCPNPVAPRCVDTKDSRFHCGDCGQLCLGDDRKCCDGKCVDTAFDNNHCGGCNPCPTGWECCHAHCIEIAHTRCCFGQEPPNHACPRREGVFCCGDLDPNGCCVIEEG